MGRETTENKKETKLNEQNEIKQNQIKQDKTKETGNLNHKRETQTKGMHDQYKNK